jgi:hypothetical protein
MDLQCPALAEIDCLAFGFRFFFCLIGAAMRFDRSSYRLWHPFLGLLIENSTGILPANRPEIDLLLGFQD